MGQRDTTTGKAAAKRDRRQARKAAEAAARRAAERRRRLRTIGLGVAVVAATVVVLFAAFRPGPELEGVERLASQGRDHFGPEGTHDYGVDAPTSGPHRSSAPRCGSYSEPLDLELAVHALEHGAVVLWYRPDLDPDAVADLRDLAQQYDSHWILSPNPRIDEAVVATAWNRRARYDDPSHPQIAEFLDTYRRRGPEKLDCPA